MPRQLAILNVLLLLVAAGAVAYIVREVTTPPAAMPLRPRATVPETAPATPPTTTPAPLPGGYAVVASKNLFSPTRSEGPPPGAQAGRPVVALPKPTLHGVVLRDGAPIAYLEDPSTKRVAGYRLGDTVAGGTVKAITADHVVLTRPEGSVDVRLRDPAKPRPAAPAAQPTTQPGQPGMAGQPGQQPSGAPGMPGVVGSPGMPGTTPPMPGFPRPPGVIDPSTPPGAGFPLPPRRLMPPNVLRRVPPTQSDATQ